MAARSSGPLAANEIKTIIPPPVLGGSSWCAVWFPPAQGAVHHGTSMVCTRQGHCFSSFFRGKRKLLLGENKLLPWKTFQTSQECREYSLQLEIWSCSGFVYTSDKLEKLSNVFQCCMFIYKHTLILLTQLISVEAITIYLAPPNSASAFWLRFYKIRSDLVIFHILFIWDELI